MFACARVAYEKCYHNIAHSSVKKADATDYWVPLLEKAFAKFCGNYLNLNGGITANGMHYLTGGATIKIDISQQSSKKSNFFQNYFLENSGKF